MPTISIHYAIFSCEWHSAAWNMLLCFFHNLVLLTSAFIFFCFTIAPFLILTALYWAAFAKQTRGTLIWSVLQDLTDLCTSSSICIVPRHFLDGNATSLSPHKSRWCFRLAKLVFPCLKPWLSSEYYFPDCLVTGAFFLLQLGPFFSFLLPLPYLTFFLLVAKQSHVLTDGFYCEIRDLCAARCSRWPACQFQHPPLLLSSAQLCFLCPGASFLPPVISSTKRLPTCQPFTIYSPSTHLLY